MVFEIFVSRFFINGKFSKILEECQKIVFLLISNVDESSTPPFLKKLKPQLLIEYCWKLLQQIF